MRGTALVLGVGALGLCGCGGAAIEGQVVGLQSGDGGAPTTWFLDEDGDGYGIEDDTVTSCTKPRGFAPVPGDCDDADGRLHPGASETDCTDPTDYNCDGTAAYEDADGDGIAACEDCDDGNARRALGLDEVGDGLDNDCNGVVDYPSVDAPLWSIDFDGDGFGADDPRFQLTACSAPSGYVANAEDCDDTDATEYPDAWEVYTDGDADGYGDPSTLALACEVLPGTSAEAGDCLDDDPSVNPGAVEVCNDGADNNCDGTPDGCVLDLTLSDAVVEGAGEGHYLGGAVVAGDLTGDGITDLLLGADGADPGGRGDAGAADFFVGPLSLGTVSAADAVLVIEGGASEDELGRELDTVGDLDGDGVAEAVVTAPTATGSGTRSGLVTVWSGTSLDRASGAAAVLGDDADRVLSGDAPFDWLGTGLAAPGDMNGDGLGDLAVGSTLSSPNGTYSGAVFVLATAPDTDLELSDADAQLDGDDANDRLGTVISSAGDLDGDGYDDLLLGAPKDDAAAEDAGAVYLVAGAADPADFSGDAAALAVYTWLGAEPADGLGSAIDAGDLDEDGVTDVVYMLPSYGDNGGEAALWFAAPLAAGAGVASVDDADAVLMGDADNDNAGSGGHFLGDALGVATLGVAVPRDDAAGADAGAVGLVTALAD